LAAHYRLKYGIDSDELAKPHKEKFSQSLNVNSVERSITASTVSAKLDMNSDSDSEDDISGISPKNLLKSSPHTVSDSSLRSFARIPKTGKNLKSRHSSFIPGQDHHSNHGHTLNGLRSGSHPLDKRRSDIPMLTESTPVTLQYHYPRNGVTLEDEYPIVTSSQDQNVIREEPESTQYNRCCMQ